VFLGRFVDDFFVDDFFVTDFQTLRISCTLTKVFLVATYTQKLFVG